jgi:hypothetical protein
MTNYKKEIELASGEFQEPRDFLWKSAIVLMCLGIFALVMWSGGHEVQRQCTETDPAAQQTCLNQLRAQALHAPAKGVVPVIPRAAAERASAY